MQFVAIQRKLGAMDALKEYIQHTGSGLRGAARSAGGYVGDALLRG